MSKCVIINPASAHGSTRKRWPMIRDKLRAALGDFSYHFTQKPRDAVFLTREALKNQCDLIIAIGGDGTLNECVNGFFEADKLINPKARFAAIVCGTGADFPRSLASASLDDYINTIKLERSQPLDIGKITFADKQGQKRTRYFINVASCGISGHIAHIANQSRYAKLFGGTFLFAYATLITLFRYKNQKVRIFIDDETQQESKLCIASICNGRYTGGGMFIAPLAEINDGLLDIILMKNFTLREKLFEFRKVYSGEHLKHPKTELIKAKRISLEPVDADKPILIEADGEELGLLPATFEILPRVIQLVR